MAPQQAQDNDWQQRSCCSMALGRCPSGWARTPLRLCLLLSTHTSSWITCFVSMAPFILGVPVAIVLAVACIFLHSVLFLSWIQLFDSVFPWTWCPVSQDMCSDSGFCYCYFDFFSPLKMQVLNSAVQRPLKSEGNCWACKRRQLKIAAVLWGTYPPFFFSPEI